MISAYYKRLRGWLVQRIPQPDAFRGAGKGLLWGAWLLLGVTVLLFMTEAFSWQSAVAFPLIILLILLLTALALLIFSLVKKAETGFLTGLAFFSAVAFSVVFVGMGLAGYIAMLTVGLGVSLLGAAWAVYKRRGWDWRTCLVLGSGSLLTLFWSFAFFLERWPTEEADYSLATEAEQLTMANPAMPGKLAVSVSYYGSGDNPQRTEFGADVDYFTDRVDGSKLIDGWSGRGAWTRTNYWDVTADRLPVNGKLWIPEGQGPFPVVLIVHGNHAMEDYSDTGYDYLGELFASHGMLTASVDQNFLNSSLGDMLGIPDAGLEEENDARGWLLLKHLEQFRSWNGDPEHPLQGKADLEKVVLIGHSRGGEAVSEAAVFNRLPAYPDDALLAFDFQFGIRGVIAIAPVDMQYHPRDEYTRIRDVNYLVIHGSHDADVSSYSGYATYTRTTFDRCRTCFKAGVYIAGANHGQFNTSWGAKDFPTPVSRWLNLQHLIPGDDQRQIAKVVFMSFLQTTLLDDPTFLPVLAHPDKVRSLFPDSTHLLAQFQSASETTIADFMEDDDVSTATLSGTTITAQRLSVWREQYIKMKWHKTGSAAAVLGWQTTKEPATYNISLPSRIFHRDSEIALSMAVLNQKPGEDVDDYTVPETVDFSIELADNAGERARIPLRQIRVLQKRLDPRVLKLHALHDNRSETVFHRFALNLGHWLEQNQKLNPSQIERISLIFDQTPAATIALERISVGSGD
ncbi:MAG: hypothetical protein AAF541_16170 [Pseudomonadota bacterium]